MTSPLVTVICLCYNHERFVREALESVFAQTYPNVQIIIVDDASTDGSVKEIKKLIGERRIEFLSLKQNIGNCAAFNKGFELARGEFVIDFALDDVLLPERIEKQVVKFRTLTSDYGVVFTDADYIDEHGVLLRGHYKYLFQKGLLRAVPEKDVYPDVVSTYFIPSPTMMMKRKVLDALGGYDATLAYEDFDFWVRSARICKYAFLNERLTKIRKTRNSMSTGWYKQGDKQLHSTYLVCKKAQKLNRNSEEVDALVRRVRFELRQSVFSKNISEAQLFFELLGELTKPGFGDRALMAVVNLPLPLPHLRDLYHSLRY